MAGFMKKQGIAFWFNAIAIVAGIVGIVAMNKSSTIDTAYAYHGMSNFLLMSVGAIVLALVAIAAPNKLGNHDILSTASVVGAVALFSTVIGGMINERVLLVAGLFSYNSQNMVGWSVFYATVTACAAMLVAVLALIIGAFTTSVKS